MKTVKRANLLKNWAKEEGFDRAGVGRIQLSENGSAFMSWLKRGDHADMGYLERRSEARLDPGEILPGARSVLSVAIQYYPLEGQGEVEGDLWPGVARYARGEDYHRFMEAGLRRLGQRVEEAFPQADTRAYVDTGPVLERELAARAGLGAVGKNTNLLDSEMGSWFLLGELFLSLELEPDVPGGDLCGTCALCLDACPTGALPAPYRLDSRLCISYWTIEHRGSFPESVRPLLGEWVFGCDICQEVCPINTKIEPADHSELEIPAARASLDLVGLLNMGRDDYVEAFRHSPMKRPKLEGLQRNAAVAMGNSGSTRYLEPLIGALRRGVPLVRAHAAWALGRLGGALAQTALQDRLEKESESEVLAEVRSALKESG